MRAAQLYEIGKPLRLVDIPTPTPGHGEVLVRVKASGICHSDVHYKYGVSPVGKLPITLGHEVAGIVEEVGPGVEGLEVGTPVAVHYQLSCGNCKYCRSGREYLCRQGAMIGKHVDGGFAEYLKAPAWNILKVPNGVPLEQAAIIGCAVSTPFHALRRARLRAGESVAVYGVGGIGIHAVQLASRIFGAGLVIAVDLLEGKLEAARQVGADETVNASEVDPVEAIKELTGGGADVVVEAVGLRKTAEQSVESAGRGGRVVLIGIGREYVQIQPYTQVILKELEIIGSSDHNRQEMETLLRLVATGRLDLSKSITHRVSLDQINEGMRILEESIGNPIRVVVRQP